MSRRPNPGADRAAQNAQTLKALVKLEGNKVCADCKRNKHPRWASWNLGVFVCIRCSGIHRGMGTHISRVKSVDLDAWTDEQLQNILKWGNTRANKYWEAKLAPGHAPSEAKIENFIRTKYDTKRWVMDGPMPDPATLDTDDDVPLNIVQEKAKIERSGSLRSAQPSQQPLQPPKAAQTQNVNLFDDFEAPPARPSTADIPTARAAVPPVAAKQKQESLLGLDFFGASQGAGIGRPSSATSNPAPSTNVRGDLKNTILSLYAPRPPSTSQPVAQTLQQGRQPSFGGMNSAPPPQQDSFSVLTDAFKDFRYTENKAKSPPIKESASSSAFSGLDFTSPTIAKATPAAPQMSSPPPLSGGSFFDSTYSKPPAPKPAAPASNSMGGLNFSFAQAPTSPPATKPTVTSIPKDLFGDDGFAEFASAPAPAPATFAAAPPPIAAQNKSPPAAALSDFGSAFNLSSAPPAAKAAPMKTTQPLASTQSNSTLFDPWGAGDSGGWGAPEPAKPAAPKVQLGSVPSHLTPNDISGGWGAPISSNNKTTTQPTVTADEDFGGWASASPQATKSSVSKASGGFGGTSDPFDNPWG